MRLKSIGLGIVLVLGTISCKRDAASTNFPTISSFTPATAVGGAALTITGSNFDPTPANNTVLVNKKQAVVLSASPNLLTVVVPALAGNGLIQVSVANRIATSSTPFTYQFVYIASTLAGSPGIAGYVNAQGSGAQFNTPTGIALDTKGNLFVADYNNNAIRKIDLAGNVTTYGGALDGSPGTVDDTIAANTRFNGPWGIAVGPGNYLYVTERTTHLLRRLDTLGRTITLAGTGTQGYTNLQGKAAQFNQPLGIVVDGSVNAYLADFANNVIRRLDVGANTITYAGAVDGSAGYLNAVGSAARFSQPITLARDGSNNLYVAEQGNPQTIRKITPNQQVSAYGLTGTNYNGPQGLVVDAQGSLFFTDTQHTVHKLDAQLNLTYVAGMAGQPGFQDGASALFNQPGALVVDAGGNLYLCDVANHCIRKLTPQ